MVSLNYQSKTMKIEYKKCKDKFTFKIIKQNI